MDSSRIPNAREFYLLDSSMESRSYFAGHDDKTVQVAREWMLRGDPGLADKLYQHPFVPDPEKLVYSNDALVDDMARQIIDSIESESLKSAIQECFVVKRPDLRPEAFAAWNRGQHSGCLIKFNVGLSDVSLQYCALLYVIVLSFLGDQADGPEADSNVFRAVRRMASLELNFKWERRLHLVEDFLVDTFLYERFGEEAYDLAVGLSIELDKFVMVHEFGHFALGHLDNNEDVASHVLDAIPVQLRHWLDLVNLNHKNEFMADAFSFLVCNHSLLRNSDAESSDGAVVGALLSIMIRGRIVNPDLESKSHPSLRRRLHNLIRIISLVAPKSLASQWRHLVVMHDLIRNPFNDGFGNNRRLTAEFVLAASGASDEKIKQFFMAPQS